MRRFLISLFFVVMICLVQTSEARKLALLVGVDAYDDVPSLKCCVNDVKVLKKALMKVGFIEDDIQILVTGADNYPTKKRIERKIREMFETAGPHDMVFLSFSGHGAQDGKRVYFCPPDVDLDDLEGTCVSIDQVMKDLEECKAQFKWVVVDACRNDPADNARSIGGKGLQVIPTPPAGIALFQSCAKGEQSWEDRSSGNGFFTKNFAEALSGAADANQDGRLTLMEVCTWTTAQTKEQVMVSQNKSQKPYFSGTVSDFTLTEDLNVPKAKALAEEAQKAMDAKNYALAIEKYDAALVLWQFDYWKRERDSAKLLLESTKSKLQTTNIESQTVKPKEQVSKLKPTSRDSFEYERGVLWGLDRTKIKKFVGKETEVVIPEGVKVIGSFAFSGCESLTSIVIPEGVTKIERHAFSCCRSLTSIIIPDSVKEIEEGAFFACDALKQWPISSSHPYFKSDGIGLLTKDGKKLIACLSKAKEYKIPEGVTVIGEGAFRCCHSLTSVVIPEGVRVIEREAFFSCSFLAAITIPEGVTVIGWHAFEGCFSLEAIVIPNSVNEIGNGAFADCRSLKQWSISSTHSYFKSDGTGLLTKDGKRIIACLGASKEYQIPKGVTEIGESAFSGCRLTSIVIPQSVTEIGYAAFRGSQLTSVVIPEGVTRINSSSFSHCESLTSVVIPESVTVIEDFAFSHCNSLKSVIIPKRMWLIYDNVFEDCPKLTIYAPAGSYTEKFAKKKHIPFQAK